MNTLKEIKRIQKLAAGEATMEDIDAQNAKPIQHRTNAQRNAAQPSKLQQLIDAVASKRGISTGIGAGVGGATGYSIGAAAGMSPKAKMLAGILGAAAGGTAGNLFAKQSAQDGPRTPKGVADAEAADREAAAAKEKGIASQFGYDGRSNPLKGALDVKPQSKLQQLLATIQNVDKTQAATTAGGAALGAGAGVGGAALMGGSGKAKILAGILGGIGGGAAGHVYGPKMVGKMQGMMGMGTKSKSAEVYGSDLTRIANTGTATALGSLAGAGAGLGGAIAFKGSNNAKLLAAILGAAAGGTIGHSLHTEGQLWR